MTKFLINIDKEELDQIGGLLFEAYLAIKGGSNEELEKELLEAVKKINQQVDIDEIIIEDTAQLH